MLLYNGVRTPGTEKVKKVQPDVNTPQPNINSPLGVAMRKIGLRIGENTGLNLNKLIQKKPSKEDLAPVTPMVEKKTPVCQKAMKIKEDDHSKDDIS
jgi:hypothetical protein